MTVSIIKLRARYRYKKFCHRRQNSEVDYRIKVWRDLSITSSTTINPYAPIRNKNNYPPDLCDNLYPDSFIEVKIPNSKTLIKIDTLNCELLNDNQSKIEFVDNASWSKSIVEKAREFYNQQIQLFFRTKEFEYAMRTALNVLRLFNDDSVSCRNVAFCLSELGDFQKSAEWYLRTAELFNRKNRFAEAGDCYERAGLLLEAIQVKSKRPIVVIDYKVINSTNCFKNSKTLFSLAGEDDKASRSYVLERDAHTTWTLLKTRKLQMKFMRYVWLYGESPLLTIRSIILMWFLFALLFFLSGFRIDNDIIKFNLPIQVSELKEFGTSLYLSAVTMSTLGYGDYSPVSSLSQFFAAAEAFIGVMLFAMLIVSIQRRFIGR